MVASSQTVFPITLRVHWVTKVLYLFSILGFFIFALIPFVFNIQIFLAFPFVLFILYDVHMLISFQMTVDVDQDAITLTSPLRGVYMMYWRDVEYIETSGSYYIFIGEDKRLVISLLGVRDGKQEFLAFFNHFVKEQHIEVEPSTMFILSQKNTKVS